MAGAAIVAVQVAIVVILFLLYAMATYEPLKRLALYFPPATVMIVVGLIAGGILDAAGEIREVFEFDPKVFFNLLLPPIIFYSGLELPKETFARNLGSIFTFAFAGTLVATFAIGLLVHASGDALGLDLSFANSMVLGSLLAAVDPVSTISIFKSAGVSVSIFTLVAGEAVLNDAVAIVINREFAQMAEDEANNIGHSVFKALLLILGVTVGSIALGIATGAVSALVHKHSRLREHAHHEFIELAVFVSAAYFSYAVAEEVHLSGIMSSLFCAVMMDHYTMWNLSTATRQAVHSLFQMLAEVAEAFVFVYLGMAVFTFSTHDFKLGFSLMVFFYCMLARALTVFPLSAALNTKRKRQLTPPIQAVQFVSGLRGAVAFALALEVPRHRDEFVSTTLFQVFLTILIFGGMTYPILNKLNLTAESEEVGSGADSPRRTGANPVRLSKHWFIRRDRDVFRPLFRIPQAAASVAEDADRLAGEAEIEISQGGNDDEAYPPSNIIQVH